MTTASLIKTSGSSSSGLKLDDYNRVLLRARPLSRSIGSIRLRFHRQTLHYQQAILESLYEQTLTQPCTSPCV